jgi:hypothetical protein
MKRILFTFGFAVFCIAFMNAQSWSPMPGWADYNHPWEGSYRLGHTAVGNDYNSNQMMLVSNSSRNQDGEEPQVPFLVYIEDYSGESNRSKAITVSDKTIEPGFGENFQVLSNGQTFVGTSQYRIGALEGPLSYPWPWEAMLWVNGNIVAEEVRVSLYQDWPDYVFSNDYELMSLSQLQAYIDTHSHLPNIPSAAELETQGRLDVGEMTVKQMEKIEELTLYLLDMNERLEKLEAENQELKTELKTLKTK